MIEFNQWVAQMVPNVGMMVWLGMIAYTIYLQHLWNKAMKWYEDSKHDK